MRLNRRRLGTIALVFVAAVGVITALAHTSCIFLGVSCYLAQMAPEFIVDSALAGTAVAPIGTLFVCGLFLLCAAYALSAARLISEIPFLKAGIIVISILCIVRGLATIPLLIVFPDAATTFAIDELAPGGLGCALLVISLI